MQVNGAAGTQSDSGAMSLVSGSDGDMFMQLLLAQLKSQDPMSPADPNEFVSQLVQLNTLGELTQIRELVQSLATPATS